MYPLYPMNIAVIGTLRQAPHFAKAPQDRQGKTSHVIDTPIRIHLLFV